MKSKLTALQKEFTQWLKKVASEEELKELESSFLWKKWKLKEILKWIKDLTNEQKQEVGKAANVLKEDFIKEISTKSVEIEESYFKGIEEKERIDVTLEFPSNELWHMHPLTQTSTLLEEIFISLWFKIEDGPQVETEEYNFDKLNIPDNHPARDVWDTFWVSDELNDSKKPWDRLLLRTHTSPVQIRTMLKWELPIKVIIPWRVFRYEQEDARHTCNFYQLEWLVVWKWVTFGDLKWTLDAAMKKLLWDKTEIRLRPSIFPFTEPSAEIDVSCQLCGASGEKCSMCSWTGWVELLGAGMVHPRVLEFCGIDPDVYSWFAFGIWIDRIATQRHGITSARYMYQSKLKLNEQF